MVLRPRHSGLFPPLATPHPPRLNEPVQFHKVTLAGVGLLGGSLGLALKQKGLARRIEGLVRRPESVEECLRLGVVDAASCDPAIAGRDADLIIVCTPIAQMAATLRQLLPHMPGHALVTDVGSVKGPVVRELEPLVDAAGGVFVGSHPMAGAEKFGPAAARADLFVGAVCALTPTPNSPPDAVRRLERLWEALGATPLRLTPDAHDDLVSRSSHLPHVVAAELANYVLSPVHAPEQQRLCATGVRDTTRIASSSPEMWRDIALANRRNLARVLGVFIEDLQEFRHALETEDRVAIEEFFQKAKQRRDGWSAQSASPSPE